MAVSIIEDKGPLSARHDAPVAKELLPVPPALEWSGSNTDESQSPEKPIIASESSPEPSPQSLPRTTGVRGFLPSQIPIPQTIAGAAPSSDEIPEPQSSHVSGEQEHKLRNNKPVFQMGGSSEEDGCLQSALDSSRADPFLSTRKKQAFFSNDVMKRTIEDEAAVDSDTDDYIDERAIDDDDSSDWQDTTEESGKSSMDDKFFQRVESTPNSTSRRSLITLMLAQNDHARTLGDHASQSTSDIPRSPKTNDPGLSASPNDADEAPLMMKGLRGPGLKPIYEVPGSSALYILTGPIHIHPQAALSPRTTRQNRLATELTESLRRHLRCEHLQNLLIDNDDRNGEDTSHDVGNLKQYPKKPCMKKSEDANASSWNQYFSKEASNGYHSKGW